MSIEENLKSIADSLKELTQVGRLNLALKAAQNSEAKTSPSTLPSSGASEPAQTEPSPSPAPTESVVSPPKRKGRPPKAAPASSPPAEPEPVATPEPEPTAVAAPEPAPAVVVETRPEPDPVDDFLDDDKPVQFPEPTSENVRKALIDYAARNGGSEPNQGGRAKARALMKQVTGCEVMPQLEALVKQKGSTEPYADVIRAAMEG